MSDKRTFKLITPSGTGRYTGTNPKQAAKKAFTYLAKQKGGSKKIDFSIQETTKDGNKKVLHYSGKRTKLKTPTVRTIKAKNGKETTITYKFDNKVLRNFAKKD